jgi:hypothetical protein
MASWWIFRGWLNFSCRVVAVPFGTRPRGLSSRYGLASTASGVGCVLFSFFLSLQVRPDHCFQLVRTGWLKDVPIGAMGVRIGEPINISEDNYWRV